MPLVLPECQICLADDMDEVSVTSCGHLFHTKCIRRWAEQPGGSKCPACCQEMKKRSKSRFTKIFVELMPQESLSTLLKMNKLEAENQSLKKRLQEAENEKQSLKEKFETAEKENRVLGKSEPAIESIIKPENGEKPGRKNLTATD